MQLIGRELPFATTRFDQVTLPKTYPGSQQVFDHAVTGKDADKALLTLKQGKQLAADFALTFHTLAADSSWNEATLKIAFHGELLKKQNHAVMIPFHSFNLFSYPPSTRSFFFFLLNWTLGRIYQ